MGIARSLDTCTYTCKERLMDQGWHPLSIKELFAMRKFLPRELISYFAGNNTVEEEFLFDNMTDWEEEDAASYYFDLAGSSPGWWGVPEGQVAEIVE